MPAKMWMSLRWKGKEIIAYSRLGYTDRAWLMPDEWRDANSVDFSVLTWKIAGL